jgi:hypothetical protein
MDRKDHRVREVEQVIPVLREQREREVQQDQRELKVL